MPTMTERKQDFSCANYYGFGDEYNLQSGTEENPEAYSCPEENDEPKVLTTMRNMFSDKKNDEYELVYDNFAARIPPNSAHFDEYSTPHHSLPHTYDHQYNQNSPTFPNHSQIAQQYEDPTPISRTETTEEEEEEDHEDDEDDLVEDNRIIHQCPECSKKYTSERRLKYHVQVHKNADAYKCPKCGYCYQSPDSLRRHWKKTPNCDEVASKNTKSENNVDSVS